MLMHHYRRQRIEDKLSPSISELCKRNGCKCYCHEPLTLEAIIATGIFFILFLAISLTLLFGGFYFLFLGLQTDAPQHSVNTSIRSTCN